MSNAAWLNQMYQAGIQSGLSDLQARVMASQAALESGWGKSGLATKANNIFGMKAGKSWSGDTITMPTKEQAADGSWYTENAAFRRYASPADALADKSAMMHRNWPGAMNAKTWDEAMAGLKNGKFGAYATDQNYASKLSQIAAKINPGDPAAAAQMMAQAPASQGLPALASQGAATANSVASALPTVGATTPMVNPTTAAAETAAATDPMGGVFGLLLQARMNQPTPVPVAAPVQRKAPDTRSEEEKLASVSQTPDFYIERMRRYGRSVA
jgi:hypothetical protein